MIVGHTKFSPDWCFGLLKQKLRRTAVNCLADLVDVVEKSANVNHAQLVGNQSGESLVPIYDWATHFNDHFKAIPNIKRFHHFHFNKASPRIVQIREFSDSPTVPLTIIKNVNWTPSYENLPSIIKPTGLSEERQVYLYQRLREFCPVELQDIVYLCPASLSHQPPAIPPSTSPSPSFATITVTNTTI